MGFPGWIGWGFLMRAFVTGAAGFIASSSEPCYAAARTGEVHALGWMDQSREGTRLGTSGRPRRRNAVHNLVATRHSQARAVRAHLCATWSLNVVHKTKRGLVKWIRIS
jgi:hypothetical protein